MRLKRDDLELLREIHASLYTEGKRELSVPLAGLISRLESSRENERQQNRERAAANRKKGYQWKSSYHPKKSKYREDDNNG